LAVNRTTLFAALACALLVFSMLGCGTTRDLQSIQLSTSNTAESAPGTLDLAGEGGTLQLYTWGNYSNGKNQLLSGAITYKISITPGSFDENGDPLPTPPNSVELSANSGLLTAVTPFICTWINTAPTNATPPVTSPAWALGGSYSITTTTQGMTSPPVFVAVASAAGITSTSNPTGECGPQATQ
jgi:hypothetical protein